MKIQRSSIIDAAFLVLEEVGFAKLSTRLVAAKLNVQAPALYWHVRNKSELIALMAESFYSLAAKAELAGGGWTDHLIAYGTALRKAMVARRDAALLCASAQPTERPEITAPRLAAPLIASGLEKDDALLRMSAVIAYTLGWVVYEQSPTMHDHLSHMIDFDRAFSTGLHALVHGFAKDEQQGRVARPPQGRPGETGLLSSGNSDWTPVRRPGVSG